MYMIDGRQGINNQNRLKPVFGLKLVVIAIFIETLGNIWSSKNFWKYKEQVDIFVNVREDGSTT